MRSPVIPVPGIPTPRAFLRMLGLTVTLSLSGGSPKALAAWAEAKATAIGSVQPKAGSTSLFMVAMNFS